MNTPKTQYHTRTTRLTVLPEGEPIFSERATHIEIDDEAAGEFVKVTQQRDKSTQGCDTLTFDPDEWPEVKSAVDTMMRYIEMEKKEVMPTSFNSNYRERNDDGELKD